MSKTLYWLQCGGCGGDSMSLLSQESPELVDLLTMLDIELLWHPSLSTLSSNQHLQLLDRIRSGEQPLDVLVVEGAVIRGPGRPGNRTR